MFYKFLNNYNVTGFPQRNDSYTGRLKLEPNLIQTIDKLGGKTFNNGLYRICSFGIIDNFTNMAEEYFPEFQDKIQVFAYDWLGRLFALDQTTGVRNESEILLIEPGAGDALEIPASIVDFHNSILVEHPDEALARPFFEEWQIKNTQTINFSDCVGYKIPLFLHGEDEVENLEIIDINVYFSLCSQLWNKTIQLKPGQSIKNISIT